MIVVLSTNQDGTLLGADETGKLFIGTPKQIGPHELTITNEVSTDGNTLLRTTSYGDTIFAQGSLTKTGFLDNVVIQNKITNGADPDTLWEEEKAITSHADDGLRYDIVSWEAK